MTWEALLTKGRIAREPTSKAELGELSSLAAGCLADAKIPELSDDGKFKSAYEAARALSVMVIRSEGYRVKAMGGSHAATFLALEAADSAEFSEWAHYFDKCREKRNRASYEIAGIVSSGEAEDLVTKVEEFSQVAWAWIKANHRELS